MRLHRSIISLLLIKFVPLYPLIQLIIMTITKRIKAFSRLGEILSSYLNNDNSEFSSLIEQSVTLAEQKNRWFTTSEIRFALEQWSALLTEDKLSAWVKGYQVNNSALKVGVIQAGNLPLVGFHDFLSVLMSGHIFVGKASSKDEVLPKLLSDILIRIEPQFKDYILWQERIHQVDAIIATGSDNSARYFEYYFGNKPHIIRKNRSSWAVLTGNESKEELQLLGEDIFRYYGLGCRNISKILVPENYQFDTFFEAIEPYKYVYNNNKYANNFDYNQSVYLLNQVDFLENGFVILKEDLGHHSPLSVVFFEYYSELENVYRKINALSEEIQCVAESHPQTDLSVPLGATQKPELDEYADRINILDWLSKLSSK